MAHEFDYNYYELKEICEKEGVKFSAEEKYFNFLYLASQRILFITWIEDEIGRTRQLNDFYYADGIPQFKDEEIIELCEEYNAEYNVITIK